jgi:hypothetical protein
MATYEEAIKQAMASCPSNVPILQTIQVRHPALPTGDLWFVDRLTPRTLGLEDGSSLSECGLDPGAPGAEPADPGTEPDEPDTEPPLPGNEPVLSSYTYVVDGVSYSHQPFDLGFYEPESEPVLFETWEDRWATWQADLDDATDRDNATEAAEAVFESDHDWWAGLKAAHDAWLATKAIHDAWLAAVALHEAWESRDAAYTAWTACIASETITQVFQPLAFEIKLASTGEHGIQDLSVTGCDVEGQFGDFIESVALSGSNVPISMTYRAYREDDLNTVQYLLEMSLSKARVTVYSFSARASIGDLINRAYLTENFTKERFPGLESRG